MIPPLIRNIIITAALFGVVGTLAWYPRDPGGATAFGVASGFGLLTFILTALVIKCAMHPNPLAKVAAAGAAFLKLALIIGGMVALNSVNPLTKGMLLGVVVGVSVVLVTATLMALGAMLTGVDLTGESRNQPSKEQTGDSH